MLDISPSYITLFVTFTILLGFIIVINKELKRAKVDRVEGLLFGTIDMILEMTNNFVAGFVGEKRTDKYVPLFFVTFFLIFIGNAVSVLRLTEIALDLTIPFTLTLMMFVYWNYLAIKEAGLKNFIKGFFEPIPFLFPIEVLGFLSKPLSLMIRMFGNILSGYIIMLLLWELNTFLFEMSSNVLALDVLSTLGAFLLVAAIGILQLYFSIFSSFIQATVFTSLSMANISAAIEQN